MEDFASDLLNSKPRQTAQPVAAPAAPSPSGINRQAAMDTLRMVPNYAAGGALGMVKGIADYAVGAAQNLANLPFMPNAAAEGVNSYIAMRNEAYRDAAPNVQNSVAVGRVAGNIIPTLAAAQSAPASSLMGRMAQSGKIGAASAFLAPQEGVDPNEFWLSKGLQAGIAGTISFAAPALLEPVFRGLGAAVNAVGAKIKGTTATLTGKTSDAAVREQIRIELQREGVDWNNFSEGLRNSLTEEAKKALKAGGELDPQSLMRLAKGKQFGVELTQGQVTRNPLAWSREQNLARTEPGQDIATRLTEQNSALVGQLDQRVQATGAKSTDPYDVGTATIAALKARDTAIQGPINAAYASARDNLGRAAPMDVATFSRQANLALDEKMLGSSLPPEIRSILNDVSAGKIPLTVNSAVQMDRVMSAAQRKAGQGTPEAMAIGEVRKALNSAPIADNVGVDAKTAFDAARDLAKKRFDLLGKTPAMADAVEPGARLAPEKFVEKYVISNSASIDDVTALMKQLTPDAKMQLQGQVMAYLRDQAINNAPSEVAKFSQSAFKKALDRVGDRKLQVIFGDNGAKQLRTLQEVGALTQVDPIAAGVNRSWTTPAAIDFLDRTSKMPVVGALMGKPGDLYRGYLAGQALSNPLGTPQSLGTGVLPESFLQRLQPRIGLLGAPLGVGAAASLIQ